MLKHQSRVSNQSYLANVPGNRIQHSRFDRSHGHSTAIIDDIITPIFLDEILPGDTVNIKVNAFSRLNPTIAPLMDNVFMDIHFFFVPNRLVWNNWQRFNGEQDDPGDSTDFLIPQINTPSTGWPLYSLGDFYGLPINQTTTQSVSALPIRGYNLIYNEWYRDQNLQLSLNVPKGDGPDTTGAGPTDVIYNPQMRNKKHDYFTSALPWPQKGPSIPIPSASVLPVTTDGSPLSISRTPTGASWLGNFQQNSTAGNIGYGTTSGSPSNGNLYYGGTGLEIDLTANSQATINALRQAFSLQSLYERDARGGTRYTEIIRAHFGVVSPDARLQRPEYLGGGTTMVIMNPIAQTSEDGSTPQGNLVGNGVAVDRVAISKSFTEHGYLHGFVSYRGNLSYSQGIDRHWSRKTRWDYFWPDLANIGEQAILKKELLSYGNAFDEEVFGYQERYAEYKYKKNMITSLMRPDAPSSVAYWHLSQELNDATLGAAFVRSQTPFDRVLQVPSEPTFLCDFFFDYKHSRPMGTHSIPGGLTRF